MVIAGFREQSPGRRKLLIDEGRRPSAGPAPGPCGLEPGLRALVDDRARELRWCPKDVKDELAPAVVVSMDSVSERRPISRPESSSTVSISRWRERIRRSSFQPRACGPSDERI